MARLPLVCSNPLVKLMFLVTTLYHGTRYLRIASEHCRPGGPTGRTVPRRPALLVGTRRLAEPASRLRGHRSVQSRVQHARMWIGNKDTFDICVSSVEIRKGSESTFYSWLLHDVHRRGQSTVWSGGGQVCEYGKSVRRRRGLLSLAITARAEGWPLAQLANIAAREGVPWSRCHPDAYVLNSSLRAGREGGRRGHGPRFRDRGRLRSGLVSSNNKSMCSKHVTRKSMCSNVTSEKHVLMCHKSKSMTMT